MASTNVLELTREEIDALEPTFLGPTWRHADGGYGPTPCNAACAHDPLGLKPRFDLPKRTLGWQIAAWVADYLLSVDEEDEVDSEDENARQRNPFRLTLEQLRFLLWWYAVDEDGRFIYRTGVLQRLKGWGKDPLGAVMAIVEFVGPSRVRMQGKGAGRRPIWGPDGNPIGVPHPRAWVQIAAVSKDQTKNTMTLMPALMSKKLVDTYGIKDGAELIRADRGRKRLEAVTSNYRTLEGARSTFVLLNETHHWVSGNQGDKMYETVDGNATKKDSRYLAITNAYLPGEDSVAEIMRLAYNNVLDGLAPDVGTCYDSVEAHPKTPMTRLGLEVTIPKIRGDATWLRVDAIIKSIQNEGIGPARSRRMWLNQIVADEDAVYKPEHLEAIKRDGAELKPGEKIVLGMDGGKTDDSTALVAIRVSDGCAFLLDVWEKPAGWPKDTPWQVPHARVDSAVHDAHRLYEVAAFFADVAYWESYITSWTEAYGAHYEVKARPGSPVGWDMRQDAKRNTLAHERMMDAVMKGLIGFDGNAVLRRHALNARRRVNNHGVSFGKEDSKSPLKVDAYAAWMLAHEAYTALRTNVKKAEPESDGMAWFL